MNENNGFIVIHRKILDWEWYRDTNTKTLFIHCLLKANWKDSKFQGIEVPRGSFVTSLKSLSEELSNEKQQFTIKNIRTSLKHLERTKEVASKTFSKFRVITVINYDLYQDNGKVSGRQVASNGQATGRQVATIEQYKQSNKETNNSNNICKFVEENFGRTLAPIEYEEITSWEDNELTRYAIKQAITNNKCSVKYISRILSAYERENIKTVQQAQVREREYNEAKRKKNYNVQPRIASTPEWFDKKVEKRETTVDERKEMEELLREYR